MKAFILAALIAATSSANAQVIDGNGLLSRMESQDPERLMSALLFVSAVAESLDEIAFCIPEGATARQAMDIARAQLITRPSDRHLSATPIVISSLAVAWPCSRTGGARNS